MKLLTKKSALIVMLLLTLAGVLTALAAGACLLWEMKDVYMLDGVMYTMQPQEQLRVLLEVVDELADDGIECGVVAAVALTVSMLSSLVATVLACLIKPAPQP